MPRKRKDEFPLLTHTDDRVEDLRRLVPKAMKQWDADAIHDARVATRRLKAAIDVLQPILSSDHRKPFGKILRKLRRQLGPLRDLDVMLDHLEHLGTSRSNDARRWVIEHLESDRDELRKRTTSKMDPPKILARLGAWWGVREELAECRDAVDVLLAESLHLQLDAFIERAGSEEVAGDPHALRIAGKSLRYTLEMAVEEGHRLPAALMRAFKQMQDALGQWHDFVVLAERLMQVSLDEQLPHHDAAMQLGVLDLARICVSRAARQLDRFSSLWSARGGELTRAIRESFPLSRPSPTASMVNESQTDRDPPGSAQTPPTAAAAQGETSAA
jgi:CHAD domain-containing protein